MKIKIGHWSETDAKFAINYFSKSYARECGINDYITVEMLNDSEYGKRFEGNSSAKCVSKENGKSEIVYSQKVIENLTSNEMLKFLRGLQTVFHEVVHAKQNNSIYRPSSKDNSYDGNTYRIALETIAHKALPNFYDENYTKLIKEYQAERIGLEQALRMMKMYYKQDFLEGEDIEAFLNEMLELDGRTSYETTKEVTFEQDDVDAIAMVSFVTDEYIKAKPEEIDKMPVLRFAYNQDGSKKDIIQLFQERAKLVSGNSEQGIQNIDDLYRTISNYRTVTKDELLSIIDYIEQNKTDDEFVFSLMRYRLEKLTNSSEDKINRFIENEREIIRRLREGEQDVNEHQQSDGEDR